MIISLIEFFRLVVVTFALGYIFSSSIKLPKDIEDFYKGFDWGNIKIAVAIAAPAVLLHELGHKFTALAFGINAEFFASYLGLGIGVLLRLINSPLLLFVPGYVNIANATSVQSMIIAFMGPFMNLLLWIGAFLLLKYRHYNAKASIILYATKRINMILFIFNMLPIPPFDGFKVLSGLFGSFGF
ncbi:site-2 protease family protein [Candidatus Woesearchaeota archaeon]|nr:site-2 protease family protein [Candidatus Woesearchaeota archaeon]